MGTACLNMRKLDIKERISYGQSRVTSFTFLTKLKSNKFSNVWIVRNQTHKTLCVLKVTKKVQAARFSSIYHPINEQSILGAIHHSLICNMIEAFQDTKNLYIVLEFMPYGSLRQYLHYSRTLSQSQARFVMICILLSIQHLHKQDIAHLDIKPENILIDDFGYFRLCDFNLSLNCKNRKNKSQQKLRGIGTYGYQAPQILQDSSLIGRQSDLYSIGVVCAQLLTGISKRNTQNFSSLSLKKAANERVNISNKCIDFMEKLLQKKPEDRIGNGGNFQQIWRHPWLQLNQVQKKQYLSKQVPSFVHDQYRRIKQEKNLEGTRVESENNMDQFLRRVILEDVKFQNQFSDFKTITSKLINAGA